MNLSLQAKGRLISSIEDWPIKNTSRAAYADSSRSEADARGHIRRNRSGRVLPGYTKKVRAVPAWLKRQAYTEYGITEYKTGGYEVDHLIPLSLGGSKLHS